MTLMVVKPKRAVGGIASSLGAITRTGYDRGDSKILSGFYIQTI
jgi:hypothetical protein